MQQPQPALVNLQIHVVSSPDRLLVPAVNGVVSQQIFDALRCADVVCRNKIQPGRIHDYLERGSSDATQPIDGDIDHDTDTGNTKATWLPRRQAPERAVR